MELQVLINFFFSPVGNCILIGFLLLLFLKKSGGVKDVWLQKGVPQVKAYPLVGSLLDTMTGKPLHEVELERHKELGPIYGYYEGNNVMLSVIDPKHLRNIMVKDFQFFMNRRGLTTGDEITERMIQLLKGEDWKRIRAIVSPTFTTGKIRRMMEIFSSCSKVLVENFRTYAKKGEPINTKKIYGAFTMDIIASAAFSTKLDSHNDPNNEFVEAARTVFSGKINYRFLLFLIFPRLMSFFKVPIFPQKGLKFFTKVTLQIIEERKRTGQKRNDFLQLLMDTAEELKSEDKVIEKVDELLSNYESETNDVFKNIQFKKALSFNELVAQCVIFFLAGFETTASALSFISYHLALNPAIQDKLVEEIDQSIKDHDGKLTYEAIQNMKYLDNVLSEALRINPPSVRLERVANDEYVLGDTGITIPKGTVVTIPTYTLHRDPKHFPDPEKFDPDRFLPEERVKRDPYSFMPFGSGPRNCVGMRFALVEAKVCLAYVLSNFRIKRCSQTKVPLEYFVGQGLLQPKEIVLVMEERKDSPLKS